LTFSFSLKFSMRLLWPMIYLEVYCLTSKYLRVFHLLFCFNSFMNWEHTLYGLYYFKLVKACLMNQIVVCLGECSKQASWYVLEESEFCSCWVKYSINVT
jgi:hypothetical protein